MFHHYEIQPSTPSSPACGSSVLLAGFLKMRANVLSHQVELIFWSHTFRVKIRTFSCSVGNGPPPTLVVYALITPITVPIALGGIPSPVHTPPIVVAEEVTNGYVPKSRSSIAALAPSTSTFLP